MSDMQALIDLSCRLAIQAGEEIVAVQQAGFSIDEKADGSPVTIADQRAEALILKGLKDAGITLPVVAEEQMAAGTTPVLTDGPYLCIDPLDGTKEFSRGGTDFTVNIGCIENGEPLWGVIFIPATRLLYWGVCKATGGAKQGAVRVLVEESGAYSARTTLTCTAPPADLRIVATKSHMTEETRTFLERFKGADIVSVGSSLKFTRLAEGAADLYPRFGPTMEWDTSAGDAILRAAGGMTYGPDGAPFAYQKPDFRNGHFIASASLPVTDDMWP
ncbi:MAG: 3'(2'),5'-bisphosphate nucleotidase CysQ [Pseudomonadota bacterium]